MPWKYAPIMQTKLLKNLTIPFFVLEKQKSVGDL